MALPRRTSSTPASLCSDMRLLLIIPLIILSGCSTRLTCDQFGNQAQALEAYRSGAKHLDGNHNGIPCESLK